MQGDVLVCKAFGFEGIVQRIMFQTAAVHADENLLARFFPAERHMRSQPAFDPAALIIVAPGTFQAYF